MKSFFTVINIYNEEGNFNEGIYKLRTYDCGKFKIPDIIYSQIPEPHYEHVKQIQFIYIFLDIFIILLKKFSANEFHD